MKRTILIVLSLALAAFVLAGCGDNDVYERPGTGTTVEPNATEAPLPDGNGSYSADPDGEVNQTTDGDGILEDGMNDLENGIDEGADAIENGADKAIDGIERGAEYLEQGAEDILDGNTADPEADANTNAGTSRTDMGDSHGATNGNSR